MGKHQGKNTNLLFVFFGTPRLMSVNSFLRADPYRICCKLFGKLANLTWTGDEGCRTKNDRKKNCNGMIVDHMKPIKWHFSPQVVLLLRGQTFHLFHTQDFVDIFPLRTSGCADYCLMAVLRRAAQA